jgi:hypothetical protein
MLITAASKTGKRSFVLSPTSALTERRYGAIFSQLRSLRDDAVCGLPSRSVVAKGKIYSKFTAELTNRDRTRLDG